MHDSREVGRAFAGAQARQRRRSAGGTRTSPIRATPHRDHVLENNRLPPFEVPSGGPAVDRRQSLAAYAGTHRSQAPPSRSAGNSARLRQWPLAERSGHPEESRSILMKSRGVKSEETRLHLQDAHKPCHVGCGRAASPQRFRNAGHRCAFRSVEPLRSGDVAATAMLWRKIQFFPPTGCHEAMLPIKPARRPAFRQSPCPKRNLWSVAIRRTVARSSSKSATTYAWTYRIVHLTCESDLYFQSSSGWRRGPPASPTLVHCVSWFVPLYRGCSAR
jgi:hypothetical protein